MHPVALYIAATTAEQSRGQQYAAVDALPLDEPLRASRLARLAASLRRLVASLRRRVTSAASA